MDDLNVSQPQAQKRKDYYAGFWWRFLAYLIDSIIINIVEFIIVIPFMAVLGISVFAMENFDSYYMEEFPLEFLAPILGIGFTAAIISIAANWLYFAIMESSKYQATLGKLILGMYVCDMQGNRINFLRATGRYFGKILSGMILLIGYIMAGFTDKKQALHDILASCLVIKKAD